MQSEKLAGIGTLASGIAHEINNPLYGIMLEEEGLTPSLKEYTRDIIGFAQGAAEIIKDLTTYSRSEGKKMVSLNAVQAMNGSGVLTLQCRQAEGNAPVSVENTGHRIEEKNLEEIFHSARY